MRRDNLGQLIKEEIVKRFEGVVTEEIRQHNLIIERQNSELKRFSTALSLFESKLDNIVKYNRKYHISTDTKFKESIEETVNIYEDLTKYIRKSCSNIEDLKNDFKNSIDSLVSKDQLYNKCLEVCNKINDLDKRVEEALKFRDDSSQKEIIRLKSSITILEDLVNFIKKEFHTDIQELTSTVKENIVDAKGVLRELQVHKKEVFIHEKKIENLYTLISRSNKRVDTHHDNDQR